MTDNESLLNPFHLQIKSEYSSFLHTQKTAFPANEVLKIDLHCHDYNSDVPDELIGRILNVPETWLKTNNLLDTLGKNGTTAITITNHNNARSCFKLKEDGADVLVGAEFSCMVPDFNVGIHVLTYGFDKYQEKELNSLRKNLYNFQRFTYENNLPTIWAHPLYHYSSNGLPSMDFFNKLALLFERFEVINGQRDTWQNLLVKSWIETLTPNKIEELGQLYGIKPSDYCRNPYKKSFSGGSDDHMGIFAGQTGTYLHVPNLEQRLLTSTASELALEALRNGTMAPYGTHQDYEKLTIAFLDYFCQVAIHHKDPGLLRVLLHKGETQDKILALLVTNGVSELRQHKVTMRFIELFHKCFLGKKPGKTQRIALPKHYKPVFDSAAEIAKARKQTNIEASEQIFASINEISETLTNLLYSRLNKKIEKKTSTIATKGLTINEIIEKFEIPSQFRTLLGGQSTGKSKRMSQLNLSNFLDGLSFPFLASSIILAANYTSARVLYKSRNLLSEFSDIIGKYHHPKRAMWLTDTYGDKNGVSVVLKQIHEEIKKRKLPIDIVVCSNTLQPDDNLIVVKAKAELKLPFYEQQTVNVPDFLEIHNLFHKNAYDRVICSTEGVMGLMALYLKNAYSVDSHFYIHTDWLMFAKKVLNLDTQNINRAKRILRAFYNSFDGLFVLNSDQQKWLSGNEMNIAPSKIKLTAHWADNIFEPTIVDKKEIFGFNHQKPVVLYVGRLSHEKGVLDIAEIVEKIQQKGVNVQVVVAGTGPLEKEMKKLMPDALFLGWVNRTELPKLYSSADLLILPSKFDTFSCSVIEAMSCGLPVAAYRTKGPKDIIEHNVSGFLSNNKDEMAKHIADYFSSKKIQETKEEARKRALHYTSDTIMTDLMEQIGLEAYNNAT